jgi:hypothetical protein
MSQKETTDYPTIIRNDESKKQQTKNIKLQSNLLVV